VDSSDGARPLAIPSRPATSSTNGGRVGSGLLIRPLSHAWAIAAWVRAPTHCSRSSIACAISAAVAVGVTATGSSRNSGASGRSSGTSASGDAAVASVASSGASRVGSPVAS
jgi:hypothetical protein